MKVYLAAFLKYMDFDENRINLCEFDNIDQLDQFTTQYGNSLEIKKKYQIDIQEFLLDLRNNKAYKETKDGKPIIYLSAYYKDGNELKFIKTLYKGMDKEANEIINNATLKIGDIIRSTKKMLGKERLITSDLPVYLKNISKYNLTFSQDDLYFLKRYISGYDMDKYLDKFLNIVKKRMRVVYGDEWCKSLGFGKVKTKRVKPVKINTGEIRNINIPLEEVSLKKDNIVNDCSDECLQELFDNENYEELFNSYDLDELIKYSSDSNNPIGVRRKK